MLSVVGSNLLQGLPKGKQKEDSFHCPLTTCYLVAKVTAVYPFAQMNWQIAIDYCTTTTVKLWYLSFTEQFLSSGVMPS